MGRAAPAEPGPGADAVPNGTQPSAPLAVVARPAEVLSRLDTVLLSGEELRRSAALRHPADREARDAAHLLARWCAAAITGLAPDRLPLVQRCPHCAATDHGRPSVAGMPSVHVSLAHARGVVVASAGRRPVAVDVERLGPGVVEPASSRVVLTAREVGRLRGARNPSTAFLRTWVRKECLVKLGLVSLDGLGRTELDPEVEVDRPARAVSRFGAVHLLDWVDEDLDAVVGAAGYEPPRVRSWRDLA